MAPTDRVGDRSRFSSWGRFGSGSCQTWQQRLQVSEWTAVEMLDGQLVAPSHALDTVLRLPPTQVFWKRVLRHSPRANAGLAEAEAVEAAARTQAYPSPRRSSRPRLLREQRDSRFGDQRSG
jgi:hypothetical protein